MQRRRVGLILHGHICPILDQQPYCFGLRFGCAGAMITLSFTSAMCWIIVVALTQDDARCKGVLWLPSCTVTSAPCSINNCTHLALAREDAKCRGVTYVASCAFTSAPCSINSCTISILDPLEPCSRKSTCHLHRPCAGSRAKRMWHSPMTTPGAKASSESHLSH